MGAKGNYPKKQINKKRKKNQGRKGTTPSEGADEQPSPLISFFFFLSLFLNLIFLPYVKLLRHFYLY
jgi:hypothetical protein